MAKKVNLTGFDEAAILDMMGGAGSTPNSSQPAPKAEPAHALPEPPKESAATPAGRPAPPVAEPASPVVESEKTAPAKRKKKAYAETFLTVRNIGSLRKPVTISPGTHSRLDAIVRIALDGRISLSNYVDNILLHHIDEYSEDLKSLFTANTQNFFLESNE